MSEGRAPERWTDSLPAQDPLRQALSSARADLPSRDRLDRVFGGVMGAGGLGGGPGGEGGDLTGPSLPGAELGPAAPLLVTAAKVTAPSGLAKLVAVVALGAASVTAAVWVGAPEPAAPPEPPRSPAVVAAATPSAMAAPAAAPPSAAPPLASTRPAAAPSAEVDDGTIETALLREAQASLASAPSRSLELADEAERRFPRGALAQERQVIRIQALIALGRRDEAVTRARALLAANPTTAHRPRLEQLMPELANGSD